MPISQTLTPVDKDGWLVDPPIQAPETRPAPVMRRNIAASSQTSLSVPLVGGLVGASSQRQQRHENKILLRDVSPGPSENSDIEAQSSRASSVVNSDGEQGVYNNDDMESNYSDELSEKPSRAPSMSKNVPSRLSLNSVTSLATVANYSSELPAGTSSGPSLVRTVSTEKTGKTKYVVVDGTTISISVDARITLETLGMTPFHFMYIDGDYIQLDRRGVPLWTKIEPRDGMVIDTIRYPSMRLISEMYWAVMFLLPKTRTIKNFLSTTWGFVGYQSFMALATALVARPAIARSGSPADFVLNIIAVARIIEILFKDTLHHLLVREKVSSRVFLTLLVVALACVMIAGSLPLWPCFQLIEYHLFPILLILDFFVFRVLHEAWLHLGRNESASLEPRKILVVAGPVICLIGSFILDIYWRVTVAKNIDVFTCSTS